MKKTNKKGFTIVELIIVIAVIAILAAVLIPTFSGVVAKANQSAAKEVARNAYTEALLECEGDLSATTLTVAKCSEIAGLVGATSVTYTAATTEPAADATFVVVANGYTVTYTFASSGTTITIA